MGNMYISKIRIKTFGFACNLRYWSEKLVHDPCTQYIMGGNLVLFHQSQNLKVAVNATINHADGSTW